MMKALEVSKFIIYHCSINNWQLQNILYLSNVFYIMKTGTLLIEDNFEAWHLGPCIPEVVKEYSIYAGAPILQLEDLELKLLNSKELEVIKRLAINLSHESMVTLRSLATKKDCAWDKTYIKGCKVVIPKTLIFKDAGYEDLPYLNHA